MSGTSKKATTKKKKIVKKEPSTLESDLLLYQKKFQSERSNSESEAVEIIQEVISMVDIGPDKKGFAIWTSEELIRAREKLSRYSETLGEWISYYETRSDFAYIWRKGKMASDWQPTKAELSKTLNEAKITISEIESELTKKYLDEQYFSMFHRRRADELTLLLHALDRMLRSIDARLMEIGRQLKLSQDPHAKF